MKHIFFFYKISSSTPPSLPTLPGLEHHTDLLLPSFAHEQPEGRRSQEVPSRPGLSGLSVLGSTPVPAWQTIRSSRLVSTDWSVRLRVRKTKPSLPNAAPSPRLRPSFRSLQCFFSHLCGESRDNVDSVCFWDVTESFKYKVEVFFFPQLLM